MNNDPIRMEAKYTGKCSKCGEPIHQGEEMFFFPARPRKERSLCYDCGEEDYLECLGMSEHEEKIAQDWWDRVNRNG